MVDDTVPCFGFPAIGRKKVAAVFDGGRLTSDGGVMVLSLAERRRGIYVHAVREDDVVPDAVRIAATEMLPAPRQSRDFAR